MSYITVKAAYKKNLSIRTIRKDFGWGVEDSNSSLLNTFDEDAIKNALQNAQKTKK